MKKLKQWIAIFLLWMACWESVQAMPPAINSAAFAIKDMQSNTILAEHNLKARIEPAALIKLMTAYLTFQAVEAKKLDLNQSLTLSESGWRTDGSRIFLQPHLSLKTQAVIQGMLTVSANDAAITLAEAVAGSETAFVKRMNAEAIKLGMRNSHFVNCTGLPVAGQYSSIEDILILSQALMRDFPQYQEWFAQTSFSYRNRTQLNRNLLLFRDNDIDGLMTGYSIEGGYSMVVTSKQHGRRLIAVIIGSDSSESRAVEASKLLTWALTDFNTIPLYKDNKAVMNIEVYGGNQATVKAGFADDAYVTLSALVRQPLRPILTLAQPVPAPIHKGQVLGTLTLMTGGTEVAQKPLVALNEVEEAGWFSSVWVRWAAWWKQLFAST